MKKPLYAVVLFGALLSGATLAQSSPGLTYGQVPSAAQWNGYFGQKQDVVAIPGNSVLGNGTASLVSGQQYLSMPSCSGTNAGLQWTTNTGFGCVNYTFPSATLPTGEIYVGGLTNVATAQAVSGDATLSYLGALTVGAIGGKAVSLGGPLTFSGAFTTTFTVGTTTNLTLPASGTVTALGNSVTGSGGVLVEQTSPVLVTPSLGAASGTSLNLAGAVTSTGNSGGTPLASAAFMVYTSSSAIFGSNGLNATTLSPVVFGEEHSDGTGYVEAARFDVSQRFLLGYTSDQGGGQKFQVSGSGYVSGGLAVGGTTAPNTGQLELQGSQAALNLDNRSGGTGFALFTDSAGALNFYYGSSLAKISNAGHVTFEGVTSTGATGTGNLVFGTSPTFVTPALGTPASGVLTNATGLPISTGVSGLGTGVATLLSGVSSGTGGPVGTVSPTFTTPVLGAASGTSLNLAGAVTSTGNSGSTPLASAAFMVYASGTAIFGSNGLNATTLSPVVFGEEHSDGTGYLEAARFDTAQRLLVGYTADQGGGQRLQVNGGAYISGNLTLGPSPTLAATSGNISLSNPVVTNGYTVSGLPAGIKGARAHVTDATSCTFGGTLTGGGSTYCPVTYNGSAWVGG